MGTASPHITAVRGFRGIKCVETINAISVKIMPSKSYWKRKDRNSHDFCVAQLAEQGTDNTKVISSFPRGKRPRKTFQAAAMLANIKCCSQILSCASFRQVVPEEEVVDLQQQLQRPRHSTIRGGDQQPTRRTNSVFWPMKTCPHFSVLYRQMFKK